MNVKNWIRKNWTPQEGCTIRVCRLHDGKTLDLYVEATNKWEVVGCTVTKAKPVVIRGDVRADRDFQMVQEKAKLSTSISRYLLDFTEVASDFKWTKPKSLVVTPATTFADQALETQATGTIPTASENPPPPPPERVAPPNGPGESRVLPI